MKTKDSLFFSTVVGINSSLLWLLLNILSICMVTVYSIGVIIINASQGKNPNDESFKKWPEILKIGTHNWILPYHFMMMGICVLYSLNPPLTRLIISQTFFAFAAFEFLGIIVSYLHKWTDEAGTPLWSSVEYNYETHRPPSCGWGS